MPATPKPWQPPVIEAGARALRNGLPFLDSSETGVGKTYATCFAAREAGVSLGVICPLSVIPSWIEAAEKIGTSLAFVGNIESLKNGKGPLKRRGKHQWAWEIPNYTRLVFDEAHRYKVPTTQNGKILRDAPGAMMLSATPFAGPHEARVVGSKLGLFHWNDFESWAGRHGCKYGFLGGMEFAGIVRVPKGMPEPSDEERDAERQKILDQIHRQIFHTGRGVRIRKTDLGDLFPPIFRETRIVPTGDGDAIDAAYHEELQALKASAISGGVEFLRARQLSEFTKVPHLVEITEDLLAQGRSVLLFVNFRDTFDRLVAAFPGCARVYGGQDLEGVPREAERVRFQRDETRVFVLMIQAGGVALSAHDLNGQFPRASIILPGVSAEQVIQADGRDHRAGGLTPVHHYYLYSDCRIERRLRAKLDRKIGDLTLLLDGDLTPDEP